MERGSRCFSLGALPFSRAGFVFVNTRSVEVLETHELCQNLQRVLNQRLEKLLIFTGLTQREVSEMPELMFVIFAGLKTCRKLAISCPHPAGENPLYL